MGCMSRGMYVAREVWSAFLSALTDHDAHVETKTLDLFNS